MNYSLRFKVEKTYLQRNNRFNSFRKSVALFSPFIILNILVFIWDMCTVSPEASVDPYTHKEFT